MLALLLLPLLLADTSTGPLPYWQQRVSYDISASLDEPSGVLSGGERIWYINRSPDTLSTFALHLYLNAFRPGSRWSDADSAEGRRRFNDLQDPDFGFNHVTDVRIMGQPATPVYPFAPDSTIVRFELPHRLLPGDSMEITLRYDARPSTVARRQGREGRRFDFAQWYPRVVTYDRYGWEEHPLYPAGEFYGEFGTFRVLLDVAADQVVGATGVPVCGDPGWAQANRVAEHPVEYQRDFYQDGRTAGRQDRKPVDCDVYTPEQLQGLPARPAPGRKRIYWVAKDVHHFAMSLNPDFRYEGGRYRDVVVHVLYQPGDAKTWGSGVAVQRTVAALDWLQRIFGPFLWPQITNVHRIEGGGTEFPMMIMNGGASQGLIVHELGHNYLMGMLANNEWREGWMDEGFTSFQSALFNEAHGGRDQYPGLENFILGFDLDGYSEPVSLVSEDYRDFTTYNIMIYAKGELFLYELRYLVGDENLVRILHTYYERWKLKHVNEDAFREVAEEVSGMDLKPFFAQWLHGTPLFDYSVGRLRRSHLVDGTWQTKVEVVRHADGMLPVDVMVQSGQDTVTVRSKGLAEREWVTVVTRGKPKEVVLDPEVRTHDWNMLNNRKGFGWFHSHGRPDFYLDKFVSTEVRRDRRTVGVAPVGWYNDVGGLTVGLQSRSDYLGRFNQNLVRVSRTTGAGVDADPKDWNVELRLRNPVQFRSPRTGQELDVLVGEGRSAVTASLQHHNRNHFGFGPETTTGVSLQWVATTGLLAYLIPGRWEDAGTVEGQAWGRITGRHGGWDLTGRLSLGGGVEYLNQTSGTVLNQAYDAEGYFRGEGEAAARHGLGDHATLGFRFYAGAALAAHDVVKQRQIFLAGADPYALLGNPFLRSRGSLFRGSDFYYHAPGGGNLRGFSPAMSGTQVYALSVELERTVLRRPRAGLFNRVSLAAFGDGALSDAGLLPGAGPENLNAFGDAGVGLRIGHRLGQTNFVTRFDLPVFVSRPLLAQDTHPANQVGFRWTFSLE